MSGEFEAIEQPTSEQLATFFTDQGLGDDTPPEPSSVETPPVTTEPATLPTDIPPVQVSTQEPIAPQTQEPTQQPAAAPQPLEAVMQTQAQLTEAVRLLAEQVQAMRQPQAQPQGTPTQQAAPQAPPPALDFSKVLEIPEELQNEFVKAREDFDAKAEANALAKINLWQANKKDEIIYAANQVRQQQVQQLQQVRNDSLARGYNILKDKYGAPEIESHAQEITDLLLKESPALRRMVEVDPEGALVSAYEIIHSRTQAKNAMTTATAPAPVKTTDLATLMADPTIKGALKQALQEEILAENLQAIRNGQPLPVMGAMSGGGRPPMVSGNEMHDLNDSLKAMKASGQFGDWF
jgi:hypothetical protein